MHGTRLGMMSRASWLLVSNPDCTTPLGPHAFQLSGATGQVHVAGGARCPLHNPDLAPRLLAGRHLMIWLVREHGSAAVVDSFNGPFWA